MTFHIDEEATLDNFAHAAGVDLTNGLVTLYGVVCAGSDEQPNASHGGQLCLHADEAIIGAEQANEMSPGCRYLAVSVGIHPSELFAIANQVLNVAREDGQYDG